MNTGSLIDANAMSNPQWSIWQPHTEISLIRKRDHDECYRRLKTFVSHHHHHHQQAKRSPRTDSQATIAPPNPTFKTRMCSRWLSGCYMGDKCPCAHRIDELFERFYTGEMIIFYEKLCSTTIDATFIHRLCKSICDTACEDPLGECLFLGNTSMSNKHIAIHMPRHANMIPHCTITCNKCKSVKRIEIYSFCDTNKHI